MFNYNEKTEDYRIKRSFKESIEPEEILLDAAKPSELENQKIEVPIRPVIFRIFFGLIASVFLILAGYTAYLQLIKGGQYQQLAERNRTRGFPIFASRGIIYDRDLNQLVYNIPSFDLVVAPQNLPRDQRRRDEIVAKAAEILGVPSADIQEKLNDFDTKKAQNFLLASGLEQEKMLAFEARAEDLPGFYIEKNAIRQYPDGAYLASVIGYTGKLDTQDMDANPDYFLLEKIGKEGLERYYEKTLRGQPGEKIFETDSLGQQLGMAAQNQPQDGQNLVLALDSRLQRLLYEELNAALKSRGLKKSAALAIDPRDGGVLALVSLPNYDNNIFSGQISAQQYEKIENDPAKPLFNRVISSQYAPGSTVKPLIGSAALEEKVITKSTTIFDPGEIVLVNQYNPNIVYRFPDWKAHGTVNIFSAIAESCNVFFYTVGGGYGNIEGLGLDRLVKYLNLFGLGNKLGIDLPAENSGFVPTAQWKEKEKNEGWFTGDTYHLSIGQGDLLVTPLQMAAATASLVNGGKVIQPHLVDKIIDSDKNTIKTIEPRVLRENFISEENLNTIKKAMRQTVTAGSALLLNSLKVAVGAKTGTAQVAGQKNNNAWVTAFAPYDNPEVVLVVLVEEGGEGSSVSVPVAKNVLEKYFK